jgi:hypothetical protein
LLDVLATPAFARRSMTHFSERPDQRVSSGLIIGPDQNAERDRPRGGLFVLWLFSVIAQLNCSLTSNFHFRREQFVHRKNANK